MINIPRFGSIEPTAEVISTTFNDLTKIIPYVNNGEEKIIPLYEAGRNKERVLSHSMKLMSKVGLWRRYSAYYIGEGLDGQRKLTFSKLYNFDVQH
ncbi:hypothetical protein ACPZ2A_12625 [Lactiplantibacillus plantarum]|uniref:hypothetical protein n=1 Tax=Lactiplantibacillus plantarum TaxID=1590 RepID=UPI0005BEDEDD|nr:hypothetical protein [Lactiplantibacillus plantarum]AJO75237.1 hypothetical protein SH83_13215 [Lactiplantibacillus plantarum]KKX44202.1 hypothetical protein WH27_14325 [Lactiplantibacillus plantarum]MCW0154058.1 hypothetical protein [Lactiplantibacillus plantarum]QSE56720.1 hypothetical protein JWR92_07600 [Lactiplantibacillus plantarum]QXN28582.1 hypothetical protein KVG01_12895 [Lactiplantibacillus plantarum subsp. plantarum]